MIIGIGTDLLKVAEIYPSFTDESDAFMWKTYTQAEMLQAKQRGEAAYFYYATRFAGKEAVFKTLNLNGNGVLLNEIEILDEENGKPSVTLKGVLLEYATKVGIKNIQLSLSYDSDYAIAFAMAEN